MDNNRNEIEMNELAENLFPDDDSGGFESREQVTISIPGAILHLIDKEHSIELTTGDFSIVELKQGDNVVAALARVIGHDMIQWPLAKDESVVKLDDSHYFFTIPSPNESRILNYGLTLASKGQEEKLKVLDSVLDQFSSFRVENITMPQQGWLGVDVSTISPGEMEKEEVEISTSVYWTTIAPNVDDYSSTIARLIAVGSGQLIRGILWCGDVTVDRLKWGNDLLNNKRRDSEVTPPHPHTLMMMQRVKQMTMMSEQVATGILSGVVKVSGFFTSTVANSKVAQKFLSLLPGEIVLASLDGFNKVWDAVEVAGKNVMSTTSVVTTGLVSQRYGEDAGKVTHEGFSAAEHALGTAWAVLKIGKSLNPKSVIKPNTLAKATAQANAVRLKAAQSNK